MMRHIINTKPITVILFLLSLSSLCHSLRPSSRRNIQSIQTKETSNHIQRGNSRSRKQRKLPNTTDILYRIRGGNSDHYYYYQNNNDDPNRYLPPTLGDLDNDNLRRPQSHHFTNNSTTRRPKPITQLFQQYISSLFRTSPTLYYTTLLSLIIFLFFQAPSLRPLTHHHFVCSLTNLNRHRYHTLLTSAVSHATFSHLAMNLYAFHLFGRSVLPTLNANGISLPSFCLISALFANAVFLLVSPAGSSCVGLSGVVLSLLALDARLHPSKELRLFVRIIPIKLPAEYLLVLLGGWSLVGVVLMWMGGSSGGGVAHGTHLGGLGFGLLVYELMKRGWLLRYGRPFGIGRGKKW